MSITYYEGLVAETLSEDVLNEIQDEIGDKATLTEIYLVLGKYISKAREDALEDLKSKSAHELLEYAESVLASPVVRRPGKLAKASSFEPREARGGAGKKEPRVAIAPYKRPVTYSSKPKEIIDVDAVDISDPTDDKCVTEVSTAIQQGAIKQAAEEIVMFTEDLCGSKLSIQVNVVSTSITRTPTRAKLVFDVRPASVNGLVAVDSSGDRYFTEYTLVVGLSKVEFEGAAPSTVDRLLLLIDFINLTLACAKKSGWIARIGPKYDGVSIKVDAIEGLPFANLATGRPDIGWFIGYSRKAEPELGHAPTYVTSAEWASDYEAIYNTLDWKHEFCALYTPSKFGVAWTFLLSNDVVVTYLGNMKRVDAVAAGKRLFCRGIVPTFNKFEASGAGEMKVLGSGVNGTAYKGKIVQEIVKGSGVYKFLSCAMKIAEKRKTAASEITVSKLASDAEIGPTLYETFDFDAGAQALSMICMELMDGTLDDAIQSVTENVARSGAASDADKEILSNLSALRIHQLLAKAGRNDILHIDLKCDNIAYRRTLAGEIVWKLLDFGTCKSISKLAAAVESNKWNMFPGWLRIQPCVPPLLVPSLPANLLNFKNILVSWDAICLGMALIYDYLHLAARGGKNWKTAAMEISPFMDQFSDILHDDFASHFSDFNDIFPNHLWHRTPADILRFLYSKDMLEAYDRNPLSWPTWLYGYVTEPITMVPVSDAILLKFDSANTIVGV